MNEHTFCQVLLREARKEAKAINLIIPKGLVAMRSCAGDQFFVEGKGVKGEYVSGCCAYEAKAKLIGRWVDKAKGLPDCIN